VSFGITGLTRDFRESEAGDLQEEKARMIPKKNNSLAGEFPGLKCQSVNPNSKLATFTISILMNKSFRIACSPG
jgi:hypothetical protein